MRLRSKVMELMKPLETPRKRGQEDSKSITKRKAIQMAKKPTTKVDLAPLRTAVKDARAHVTVCKKEASQAARELKSAERELAKAIKALEKAGGKPRGRPAKA